jgi:hypothetical protein
MCPYREVVRIVHVYVDACVGDPNQKASLLVCLRHTVRCGKLSQSVGEDKGGCANEREKTHFDGGFERVGGILELSVGEDVNERSKIK